MHGNAACLEEERAFFAFGGGIRRLFDETHLFRPRLQIDSVPRDGHDRLLTKRNERTLSCGGRFAPLTLTARNIT